MIPRSTEIIVIADRHSVANSSLFESVVSAVRDGADGAVPAIEIAEIIQRV